MPRGPKAGSPLPRPPWAAGFCALALILVTTPAAAQADKPRTVQEAEALANRGYDLFQKGDYAEAISLFEQAETLSHSPVILSFIAQAQEALGQLVEALATYRRITEETLDDDAPGDFVRAQRRARRQAPLLERRLPRVHVSIQGADPAEVEVQLDGRPLPGGLSEEVFPINPGNRTLILRAPDHPPVVRGFVAEERTVSELEIVFAARNPTAAIPTEAPPPPPDPLRVWLAPAIAFGVGGAGLVLGATTGILHLTRASELRDRCPGNLCPPELEPERDTLSTLGITAGIGLGFAGAGLITGIAFVLSSPEAPVTITAGPSSLILRGSF